MSSNLSQQSSLLRRLSPPPGIWVSPSQTKSYQELIAEIQRLQDSDPLSLLVLNPAQLRAIEALSHGELAVLLMIMGNGSGKTFGLMAIMSAIMFGTANPLFNRMPRWRYRKSARICAPPHLLSDRGPIQDGIRALFPLDRYSQSRGVGKGYYSEGFTDNGWDWDVISYHQGPRESAGLSKGLICFSEPPPYDLFVENASRTRGAGLIIIECTPLNYAAWIKEELIEPGALRIGNDRREVGKVALVKGDIWDNCTKHEGGQLTALEIERQIALWPSEEREAREKGIFLHLAGRVYTHWGDQNYLDQLPAYHQEMWDKGKVNLVNVIDPHDRKPWAIAWFAVFTNDDVIAIAEWPPFEFAKVASSPVVDPEDYRDIIIEAEKDIGRTATARLIDPNFGLSPKDCRTGQSIVEMLGGHCRKCLESYCPHSLHYDTPPDSIAEGHTFVRRAIGEIDKGLRPKLYALSGSCPNFSWGLGHYGYSENKDPRKGLSERPELLHKDFADLARYLYLSGYGEYQRPPQPLEKSGKQWTHNKFTV